MSKSSQRVSLPARYGFIVSRGVEKEAFLKFAEVHTSLKAARDALSGYHFADGAGYPLMAIAKLTPFAEVPLSDKRALPPFPQDIPVCSVVFSSDPHQIKGWGCFFRGYHEIQQTWAGGPLQDKKAKIAACRVSVAEVLRGDRAYFSNLGRLQYYEPTPEMKCA